MACALPGIFAAWKYFYKKKNILDNAMLRCYYKYSKSKEVRYGSDNVRG